LLQKINTFLLKTGFELVLNKIQTVFTKKNWFLLKMGLGTKPNHKFGLVLKS